MGGFAKYGKNRWSAIFLLEITYEQWNLKCLVCCPTWLVLVKTWPTFFSSYFFVFLARYIDPLLLFFLFLAFCWGNRLRWLDRNEVVDKTIVTKEEFGRCLLWRMMSLSEILSERNRRGNFDFNCNLDQDSIGSFRESDTACDWNRCHNDLPG